jgi:hypothetical protein
MYYNTNKMGCGSDSSRMMTTLKDVFLKKWGGGEDNLRSYLLNLKLGASPNAATKI